jgi:hypothetical protein
MFMKILGAVDIFVALILLLLALKIHLATMFLAVLIIILVVKGAPGVLSFCVASIIDIIIAIVLIVCVFTTIPSGILVIAALGIAQKGFFSFL